MGKQTLNRDGNGNLKKKVTDWDLSHQECVKLGNECKNLLTASTNISSIIRNRELMLQLTAVEIQTLTTEAETAMKLFQQFQGSVMQVEQAVAATAQKPKRGRTDMDFVEHAVQYQQLLSNYEQGILPTVVRVLEFGETAEGRLRQKAEPAEKAKAE